MVTTVMKMPETNTMMQWMLMTTMVMTKMMMTLMADDYNAMAKRE